ncbi:hypothetical protein [Dysgonomonas sp. ZJ709]|uniref:hypothetical protein n=1 Tax=Dysgonomonas sp. ZJ709 TaxID=2709797 RepID=UPI0013EE303E|nr:hypothetical protein [Dysgonomonas sp. ZJ709]
MRLKIEYNNKNLNVHCTNFRVNRTSLYLYGLEECVKKHIESFGLEFLPMDKEGDIMVWTKKYLRYEILELRKKNTCLASELAAGESFCFDTGYTMNMYLGNSNYTNQLKDEIYTLEPNRQVFPCSNLQIKQLKVRLLRIESGQCMEIWQSEPIKGKHIYLGRDTGIGHFWQYLSDAPNGYCEADYPVSNLVELIVCDNNWQEICRDSNNELLHKESFPSLDQVCKSEWKSIEDKYPNATKDGFAYWLDEQMPDEVSYADRINWRDCMYSIIDPDNILQEVDQTNKTSHPKIKTEVLHTFTFLNEDYRIIRVARMHKKCGAVWYEYVAYNTKETGSYAAWYAYEYEIDK